MGEHEKRLREAPASPVAYRYWKDKFASWEYSDVALTFPAVPAGTQMEQLYSRDALAQIEAVAAALAVERAEMRRDLDAARAESARLAGERGVLAGLLEQAGATLADVAERLAFACGEKAEDAPSAVARRLAARIDAALGPATDDLLTGEGR